MYEIYMYVYNKKIDIVKDGHKLLLILFPSKLY